MKKKLSVIVCASGKLGMTGLSKIGQLSFVTVKAVMTNKASQEIIDHATAHGRPLYIGNPRAKGFAAALPATDVLLSVNYLFLLPLSVIKKAALIAVNVHDSLLPKYMGRTPNTWAIIHDEVETGITVHEITEDCDSGPIIYQEKVPITNTDTGGSLLLKMNARYPSVIALVLKDIASGTIVKKEQDLTKRSYCGKREPVDGLIDFRWSARKVYNWVRAQTKPYPGAYCVLKGSKVILWQVKEVYEASIYQGHKVGQCFTVKNKMYIRCGQGAIEVIRYE